MPIQGLISSLQVEKILIQIEGFGGDCMGSNPGITIHQLCYSGKGKLSKLSAFFLIYRMGITISH